MAAAGELNILSFFTDSVLRAPTIGCMLMCVSAGLMGVVVFLRKQSLIGEVLSHASYPGVIFALLIAGFFSLSEADELQLSFLILIGAFITSLLGLGMIHFLEKKMHVPPDAALCFILSTFFGVGLMIASEVQFSFTTLYKKALIYLYGQAATMTDVHIVIYGTLALIVSVIVLCFYKELQVMTFDRQYAKSLGIAVKWIDLCLFIFITLAVIIGIRSVGVVLMSAMLIAPVVAARQWTERLSVLFILSALFAMLSGFLGNYFSVVLSNRFSSDYASLRIVLPTGPMIVLMATIFALFSLLLAPDRGLLARLWRISSFRYTTLCENILKGMWKIDSRAALSFKQVMHMQSISILYMRFLLWRMEQTGWIRKEKQTYALTIDGRKRAAKIVRLHRLWELYLASHLGIGHERVHRNAEEMEHILTPELERQLTLLLNDPLQDPHQQPIPRFGELHVL